MTYLEAVPPEAAGAHAYLNACLTMHGEGGVPIAALGDADRLASIVACFAATLPGADRRAVGSMWWQYYASFLLPPAFALRMRGVSIDARGSESFVQLGETGLAYGFRIASAACTLDTDEVWLAAFFATHAMPVAAALKRVTGVSRQVLWGDTARRLRNLCDSGLLPDPARARRLVEMPLIDGLPNPLHRALRHGRPTACCLRDKLPDYSTCADCPQLHRPLGDAAAHAPINVSTCAAADLASPSRS